MKNKFGSSKKRIFLFSLVVALAVFGLFSYKAIIKNVRIVLAASETINCTGTAGAPTLVDEASLFGDDVTFVDAGGDGYCEVDQPLDLVSAIVDAGVTLTHPAEDVDGIDITTIANLTIEVGGVLEADGKGCGASEGPDGSGNCVDKNVTPDTSDVGGEGGDGSCHLGEVGGGGYGGDGANLGGGAYGDPFAPTLLGSGGGNSTISSNSAGGSGGGKISLNVGGQFAFDGSISAQGSEGANVFNDASGGGSGGSVYIATNSIEGSGTINVNGGTGYFANCAGVPGAGGRVAFYFNDDSLGSRSSADTIAGNTTSNSGDFVVSFGSSSPILAESGTAFFSNDVLGDSTPLLDTYSPTEHDDDLMRIQSGMEFPGSGSVTLSPAALQIASVSENFGTKSTVSGLDILFGSGGDDVFVSESFTNNTFACDPNTTALGLVFQGAGGDSSGAFASNNITCQTVDIGMNGYATITLSDTVIASGTGSDTLLVSSDNGADVIFDNADYSTSAVMTSAEDTFEVNTTGGISLVNNSTLVGNMSNPSITDFDIQSGSSWNGNIKLSGLTENSVIAGSMNADGTDGYRTGFEPEFFTGGCQASQGPNENGVCEDKDTIADISGVGGEGGDRSADFIAGGGGHGGFGGGAGVGGGIYGSETRSSFGSGGGNTPSDEVYGGAGGGQIIILTTGTMTIDGNLSVNGGNGDDTLFNNASGGGSGGQIILIADSIAGTNPAATISANGGDGSYTNCCYGGSGGGGRVLVGYYTSSTYSGNAPTANTGVVVEDNTKEGTAGVAVLGQVFDVLEGDVNDFSINNDSTVSQNVICYEDDSSVKLLADVDNSLRAEFKADCATFQSDILLQNIFISATTTKTLVERSASVDGVQDEFALYVPYDSGTGVFVCPQADTINEVVEDSCAGEVKFDVTGQALPDNQAVDWFDMTNNVLLYHLDDVGPTVISDSSGLGNNGTANGSPTFGQTGTVNESVLLNGSNQWIDTPITINQTGASSYTYMAWVKPTTTSAGTHHVMSTDNGGFDWALLRDGSNWTVATGNAYANSGFTVETGAWQHVAVVFEPGVGTFFYKNGVASANLGVPGTDASTNALDIGRNPGFGEYFDGEVDEVAVFTEALSGAEISNIVSGNFGEIASADFDPNVTKTVGTAPGVYVSVVNDFDQLISLSNAGPGDYYKVVGVTGTGSGEQGSGNGVPIGEGGQSGGSGAGNQSGTIQFIEGLLSFEDVPDSTTFTLISSLSLDQDTFNNASGSDAADTVEVTDATGTATDGFTLQISATDFTNENGDIIPNSNIYVVTTSGTGDPTIQVLRTGGNGGNDGLASYNVASDPTDPETLLGDANTFTTYGSALGSPVNLMITDNADNVGSYAQNVSFYIAVPAFTPPGQYSGEFTYTLIQN